MTSKISFAACLCWTLISPSNSSAEMVADILPNGNARFSYASFENDVAWIVNCSNPMRDCSARSRNFLLRAAMSTYSLTVFSASTEPILLITKSDITPLSHADLGTMSRQQLDDIMHSNVSVLVSFENGQTREANLEGINEVASYLSWLQTDTARALRDASLWPRDGELDVAALDENMRYRFEELLRRRARKSIPPPEIALMIEPR